MTLRDSAATKGEMMTTIKQAAKAEAERRYPEGETYGDRIEQSARRVSFAGGASWLADNLLSDENVEKAVKDAVRREMRSRTYDRHAYDEEVFEEGVADIARAALRAVLSEGDES